MDLDTILSSTNLTEEQRAELKALLLAREDGLADYYRLAAMQFGMFPFIISYLIVASGLGTPPSDEEKEIIVRNYTEGMVELRRQIEGQ